MFKTIGVCLILSLFLFNMSSCTSEEEIEIASISQADDELMERKNPEGPWEWGHDGYYTNMYCGNPDGGDVLNFEEFFDNYEQCICFTNQWLADCSNVWPPIGIKCKSETRQEVPYGAFCGN